MTWTTADFLSAVRASGQLPDAYTGAFTDPELLGFANEEMDTRLAPLVRQAASEFWVKSYTQAIVAQTADYRIHHRSMAAGLRQVCIIDTSGNEITLPQVPPDQIADYKTTGSLYWPNGAAHAVRGDMISLLPTPAASGTSLKQYFYLRRPRLVASAAVAPITAINTGTKTITCSGGIPSSITSSTPVDLTRNKAPFDNLAFEQVVTKSGNDLVFVETLPSELAVGDYVSLADQTYLVPLPVELYPLLAQAVVGRVQFALGDPRAMRTEALLETKQEQARTLLAPREDGRAPRIINHHSPLRGGRRWG